MPGFAQDHRSRAIDPDVEAGSGLRFRAELAWAFLRRDPGYRQAYAHAIACPDPLTTWRAANRVWGLEAPADPALAAEAAGVLWRGDIAPAVVVDLGPAPGDAPGAVDLAAVPWPRRCDGATTYLRAPFGLQVRVAARDLRQPLAVTAPLTRDFEVRLRTLTLLHRALRGQPPGPDVTPQQLRRLRQAVQAFDGREAGLCHREIAVGLFGAASVAREPWKSSSRRDATTRLLRLADHLCSGAYRDLLRTRPRTAT
ncbi:DUF2285 domain-containing protein [Phenylobacterium aquaticum]|uniref:DUF2285 domain-containing protein n=1 Tax=Phenylobacterium aquaticum TaxID=1763816 RepID=UPI001F5D64EC|nr:DUF2285 domain-containing protein [Phenylobacterium aquaticum]MCI3132867.1 DUF2285 domain-containing protein [Phenylobacterium aquaticum]